MLYLWRNAHTIFSKKEQIIKDSQPAFAYSLFTFPHTVLNGSCTASKGESVHRSMSLLTGKGWIKQGHSNFTWERWITILANPTLYVLPLRSHYNLDCHVNPTELCGFDARNRSVAKCRVRVVCGEGDILELPNPLFDHRHLLCDVGGGKESLTLVQVLCVWMKLV